jgi:iron complex transport system permease protein
MMGSVGDASWNGVGSLAIYISVGGAALIYWAREIDVLSLGDEPAAALGVNVETATRRIYLLAALLAAATVAAAGLPLEAPAVEATFETGVDDAGGARAT